MRARSRRFLYSTKRKPHPFHYFLSDSTSFLRFPEANEVGRWKMRYRYKFDEVGRDRDGDREVEKERRKGCACHDLYNVISTANAESCYKIHPPVGSFAPCLRFSTMLLSPMKNRDALVLVNISGR